MAKGKGNGKGKGGFFGAIVEGFGQMAYCICCMMVLGPILIIIGLVTFSSSFNNTRLKLINEYDSSVSTWNNGVGSSGAFKNLKIYAEFSKAGASTANHTVLLGMKAPEGVGDEAKTDSEKFTVIKDPWYYATNEDDKTINNVYGVIDKPTETSKGSKVTMKFKGASVATSPTTTFWPIVKEDVEYSWYCSSSSSSSSRRRRRSSSSSCSNTCSKPTGGTSSTVSCPTWCKNQGGQWKDNGKCYASTSSTPVSTGCCQRYEGSRKACFLATLNGDQKVDILSEPCSSGVAARNDNNDNVLYGIMTNGVSDWGLGFEVNVRHKDDPFVTASKLTDGCSSGTNEVPTYTTGYSNMEQPTSKNCFGLTAGEIRSQAMILLVIGAIFSIFPCSVFYYFSRSKNNRSNNNMNNNNSQYVPQIVHAGTQQPQYGQHQKQFNQQPVQGQFVQHQQPVQAQYIPQQQPVQYIGTPQPIVVQQPYAQPVQPVAPGQPQYNQGQVVQPVQVQYVTK